MWPLHRKNCCTAYRKSPPPWDDDPNIRPTHRTTASIHVHHNHETFVHTMLALARDVRTRPLHIPLPPLPFGHCILRLPNFPGTVYSLHSSNRTRLHHSTCTTSHQPPTHAPTHLLIPCGGDEHPDKPKPLKYTNLSVHLANTRLPAVPHQYSDSY